ncbi:MAG: hypothetical protein DSM107014_16810 [Gomphosphaeria aponina SAG 52.96 = DSM 107014]|uniref:DUF7734 domain-containing protein n=1 Tax=Gomphosphaeria aponina SAG 52.96 = DSM 107014 TaxID=1521640 RepID=A0A941GWV7_9CHRO|nr:hypothetical protein [Gomphosphaeria aponina SAG 52.96 = DSM 107014]
MAKSIGKRLEDYTIKCPQEVLLVTTETEGEEDQIVIFKGFSSSLMGSTSFDPDVPVLSDSGKIIKIDIVASPYNPDEPRFLRQGLSEDDMEHLLLSIGV